MTHVFRPPSDSGESPDRQADEGSVPDRAPGASEHHFLVQAPVSAMDVDGLRVVAVGIVSFTVASILAVVFYPELAARGDGWWLGVSLCGLVLGFIGLAYCWRRRRRRQAGLWQGD